MGLSYSRFVNFLRMWGYLEGGGAYLPDFTVSLLKYSSFIVQFYIFVIGYFCAVKVKTKSKYEHYLTAMLCNFFVPCVTQIQSAPLCAPARETRVSRNFFRSVIPPRSAPSHLSWDSHAVAPLRFAPFLGLFPPMGFHAM